MLCDRMSPMGRYAGSVEMYLPKPRSYLACLLGLLSLMLLQTTAVGADATCSKRVFNHFCLGWDIKQLQRKRPTYIHQQSDGERFALIYTEGRERIYVMAYQGLVYKILRQYQPPTLLRYEDLRDEQEMRHGEAEDLSRFPEHARGLASKIGAIRRGEGQAMLVWRPEPAWRVELSWTREMGLTLAYIANHMDRLQREARAKGY